MTLDQGTTAHDCALGGVPGLFGVVPVEGGSSGFGFLTGEEGGGVPASGC